MGVASQAVRHTAVGSARKVQQGAWQVGVVAHQSSECGETHGDGLPHLLPDLPEHALRLALVRIAVVQQRVAEVRPHGLQLRGGELDAAEPAQEGPAEGGLHRVAVGHAHLTPHHHTPRGLLRGEGGVVGGGLHVGSMQTHMYPVNAHVKCAYIHHF